jgi:two-component system response regulator HydG
VLLVEGDRERGLELEKLLQERGYPVVLARSGREAGRTLLRREVTVAVIPLDSRAESGVDLIQKLKEIRPTLECVALTDRPSEEMAEAAQLAGASDYFERPLDDPTRFLQVMKRACEVGHLRRTLEMLEPRTARPTRILGQSGAADQLRQMVERMAGVSAPVLITGESGVGKEVVAEALHEQGRRPGEFVRINCAALPEALIEAELFGAEEGTFTGQKGRREGLFSIASEGTLFLDEIGEMPIGLQPKLLRVLESGRFRPLGSRSEKKLTARVIAATNVELKQAIAEGAFRGDLYFRLHVLRIHVPPLRERMEDVPLLAAHFAKKFAANEGRLGVELTEEALAALMTYDWPGNVRELSNAVLRAVVLTSGRVVGAADLVLPTSSGVFSKGPPPSPPSPTPGDGQSWEDWMRLPLSEAKAELLEAFTRQYLLRRLRDAEGNVSRAAVAAGMQRPNFKREMRKYGITANGDDPTEDS